MTLDDERRAIRAELESLKTGGMHRRELSLYACKRLFFDLGIRPSMAAVRELTQTGSASDIPKDIDHFWERIRDTAKGRIGSGAIPPAVEEKAGELISELFQYALVKARESLEDEKREAQAAVEDSESRLREAEILRYASAETLQRSDARADAAWARVRELEAELAGSNARHASSHVTLEATAKRLEAENAKVAGRLETEVEANAGLRERIDVLHAEMRQNAERYAVQIKDAMAEAERRVKPMLVELDSLRSMATTYQTGIRDAGRKEFDFIQQLSAAKSRSDRLEAQVHEQSNEIDALSLEISALRERSAVPPELAAVIWALAKAGRLNNSDFDTLGTLVDAYVTLPGHCPKCVDGEPELAQVDGGFEMLCPECDHCSGVARSRLKAVARFMEAEGGRQ
ncbi:MAG TPA: DNA-binding protein [Trinickia sp.]|uniref:DNA-binding protein n=1 Tax=Trinickia sp. TaxID=2571163 RepID=UPI002C97AB89|nr:DNA-binding protein [Trinickia sp.]HTI17598.1 DNA-binding protein [Trinickia sp.]